MKSNYVTFDEHLKIAIALRIINFQVLHNLKNKYPIKEERLKSPEVEAFKLAMDLSEKMEAVMFNDIPDKARTMLYYGTRWDEELN